MLVPTFAIGRSQSLLYLLAGAFKRGTLEPFRSSSTVQWPSATDIYRTHEKLFDEEAIAMRRSGEPSKNLRAVRICQKAKDSMALVQKPGPWMVLAGAGKCTGGRIMSRQTNHLSDPSTLVLMVGYQSRGSVGRALASSPPARAPCSGAAW